MTVVKFSILTLLAGGFCTLLGVGMWMGPQETPCNAQSGVTTVAVVDSAAPVRSCWSQPAGIACDAKCASEAIACGSGACVVLACTDSPCESGACDLVATPAPVDPSPRQTQASAPQAVVASIQTQGYGAYPPTGPCDSGVCTAPGIPCPPYPPLPTFATTSVYHVAPCTGPGCPPSGYTNPYGVATAYAAPMPMTSPYASYEERESRTSDQPSMEMIEAFMQEREKRYEAQVEALQAQMELKLEAQEAILKAEHEVAMAKLHAEAFVKLACMEQALREEKALLQLVAEGTLPTEALRAILARNRANGHGESTQPVSTAAACACEKCGCETCKCVQTEVSTAVSADCKRQGDCPAACEKAVSTAAPSCSPCKTTACETAACMASACATSACAKSGECKSCDATTVVSVEACEACTKSCDACTPAPKSLERIGVEFDFEGEKCTILSDGIPMAILGDGCTMTAQDLVCIGATQCPDGDCTIVFGQKTAECAKGECKTVEFRMGKKSVAVETPEAPFVCEKDGCTLEVTVTEVPFLSDIPYVGRLFRNVGIAEKPHEEAASAEAAQR